MLFYSNEPVDLYGRKSVFQTFLFFGQMVKNIELHDKILLKKSNNLKQKIHRFPIIIINK